MQRLLIVDDSLIDRRLVKGLLQKEGAWTLEDVADGQAALDAIRNEPPDLVLTDLQMPLLNGLELVSTVRRDFPLVPVVLMTGQGSEDIAMQALHGGAAGYVPKRLLAAQLAKTVHAILESAREERSHVSLLQRLQCRREDFRVENDLKVVMAVPRYLRQLLGEAWGVDPTIRIRISTAIEEAILNALYHGNLEISSDLKEQDYGEFYRVADARRAQDPYRDRGIHVSLELSQSDAVIRIRDEGRGFDVSKLPDPTDPANLERASGRGVMLMRAFMDHVEYNGRGNEVVLTKRRPQPSAARS
jgi:CheY-like chemotaxis protein